MRSLVWVRKDVISFLSRFHVSIDKKSKSYEIGEVSSFFPSVFSRAISVQKKIKCTAIVSAFIISHHFFLTVSCVICDINIRVICFDSFVTISNLNPSSKKHDLNKSSESSEKLIFFVVDSGYPKRK